MHLLTQCIPAIPIVVASPLPINSLCIPVNFSQGSFIIFSSGFEEQGGKRRLHDLYLSTLSRSGHLGSISPFFSCFPLLLPLSVLFLFFFVFCQFLPIHSRPLSYPLNSCSTFIYDLNSLSHVQDVFFAGFGLNFCWEEGGKERHAAEHTAASCSLWEEEGSPFLSLLAFILHIN